MSGYCEISSDGKKYRYVLGKESSLPGAKKLYCIGVNPSTATVDGKGGAINNNIIRKTGDIVYDCTICRVQKVADKNGFQDWEMLNLYPQIATDITNLDRQLDSNEHQRNLDFFRKIPNGSTIWAAWGGLITKRSYLKKYLHEIVQILNGKQSKWVKLNLNTKHPHHPLRTSEDVLVSFCINCGTIVGKNVKVCPSCGSTVD